MQHYWQLAAEDGLVGVVAMFPLHVHDHELRALDGLLSDAERARAARFHSPDHGRHFTAAHGRLRQLLAGVLGLAPQSLQFEVGAHGKPELAGPAAATGLRFNLSHSAGMGLVGWAWGRDIGVDIEAWRPMRDQPAVVRRYFSSVEIEAWKALPGERREQAFFEIWTRKEAYIKALGLGLSLPLDSFDVHFGTAGGNLLARPSAEASDHRHWSLVAPETGTGISVAVALEAGFCHIEPTGGDLEY